MTENESDREGVERRPGRPEWAKDGSRSGSDGDEWRTVTRFSEDGAEYRIQVRRESDSAERPSAPSDAASDS